MNQLPIQLPNQIPINQLPINFSIQYQLIKYLLIIESISN